MAYEARKNSQSDESNTTEQIMQQAQDKRERNRENTKQLAKDAGSVALQAHGVPGEYAEKAVNAVADNKYVDKALNKISDKLHKDPGLSKAINTVAESPLRDTAKEAITAAAKSKNNSGGSPTSNPNVSNLQTAEKALDAASEMSSKQKNKNQTENKANRQIDSDSSQLDVDETVKLPNAKSFLWIIIGIIGFVFFLIFFVIIYIYQFFPMFGTNAMLGIGSNDMNYVIEDPNSPEGKYYTRLKDIYQEYKEQNKEFNAQIVTAVYYVTNMYNQDFTYDDMDNNTIRKLADLMLSESSVTKVCEKGESSLTVSGKDTPCPEGYTENIDRRVTNWIKDEEAFKKRIKNEFLKEKLPHVSDAKLDEVVDEIFKYIEYFKDLNGDSDLNLLGGMCYVNGNTQASIFNDKTPSEVLEIVGPIAQADYSRNGILASVTLAQFIIESGWGKQDMEVNNLFGIKCDGAWTGDCKDVQTMEEYNPGQTSQITAKFKVYPSVEASFADHTSVLLLPRYEGITSATTPKEQLEIIKKGGYATASNYVDALLDVIEGYNLEQWDVIVDTTSSPLSCLTNWTVRTIKPTANDTAFMYINSNRGQCVWYAQGRAIEIVESLGKKGSLSEEQVKNIRTKLLHGYGNAEGWYPYTQGVFKRSNDVKDLKAGSIIVWGGGSQACTPACGHVAIVEDVNVAKNTVTITDGWSTSGGYASCPNDFSCVTFRNRTMSLQDYFKGIYNDFGASRGTQFFKGYVYFLEPES